MPKPHGFDTLALQFSEKPVTRQVRCKFRSTAGPRIASTDLFSYDVSPAGKWFLLNRYVKPEHRLPLSHRAQRDCGHGAVERSGFHREGVPPVAEVLR